MNDEDLNALDAMIVDNRHDYEDAIDVSLQGISGTLSDDQREALVNLMQATVKLSVVSAFTLFRR